VVTIPPVAVAPLPLVDVETVEKFKFPLIVALLDTVRLSTARSPAQAGTDRRQIDNKTYLVKREAHLARGMIFFIMLISLFSLS